MHLHGASSCGKTSIQRLATSVWRDPKRVGSWRVTANGVEELAQACNSMLLPLDEIAEISGKDLDQATYMLANGTGKVRANAQGSNKPPALWRVAILSTGEISVAEKIAEAGHHIMAGQGVRLLDIDAQSGRYGAFDDLQKSGSAADFADGLKRASMKHHGTAGPVFIKHLIANKSKLSRSAGKFIDKFADSLERHLSIGQDGQVHRVARRLAAIAGAGELATKFGLTGWSNGDAMSAATKAMELWVDAHRKGKPVVDAENAGKDQSVSYRSCCRVCRTFRDRQSHPFRSSRLEGRWFLLHNERKLACLARRGGDGCGKGSGGDGDASAWRWQEPCAEDATVGRGASSDLYDP